MNKLNKIIAKNHIPILIVIITVLSLMQFPFFWNEYINNFTSNVYTNVARIYFNPRPLGTFIYQKIFEISFLNNIFFLWILQVLFILVSVIIFYRGIKLLLDNKISFYASILFVLSPYTINLLKVLDLYPLTYLLFAISNYLFISQIFYTKDKNSFLKLALLNIFVVLIDYTFLAVISTQWIYLYLKNKIRRSYLIIYIFIILLVVGCSLSWLFTENSYSAKGNFIQEIKTYSFDVSSLIRTFGLFKNRLLEFSPIFIILLSLIGIYTQIFRKNKKTNFLTYNFCMMFLFFILIFFSQIPNSSAFNFVHPTTRYFIFFFYWLYPLVAFGLNREKIGKFIIFIIIIIMMSYYLHNVCTTVSNIKKDNQISRMFDIIYSTYDSSYIIFVFNENEPENKWSSLYKYSFDNPSLLKAEFTKWNTVEGINKDLSFVISKNKIFNIMYNNLFEYDNRTIITMNEHITMGKQNFARAFIDSALNRKYNIIVVPLCCNMSFLNDYPLNKKFISENETHYIYLN